ncbi:hypothetical protein D3C75_1157020 [compost metagenome]
MECHSAWGDAEYLRDVTALFALGRPAAHLQLTQAQGIMGRQAHQTDSRHGFEDMHGEPGQRRHGGQPLLLGTGFTGDQGEQADMAVCTMPGEGDAVA